MLQDWGFKGIRLIGGPFLGSFPWRGVASPDFLLTLMKAHWELSFVPRPALVVSQLSRGTVIPARCSYGTLFTDEKTKS